MALLEGSAITRMSCAQRTPFVQSIWSSILGMVSTAEHLLSGLLGHIPVIGHLSIGQIVDWVLDLPNVISWPLLIG